VLFVVVFDVELVGNAVGKVGKTLVVFGNVEGRVMLLMVGIAVCVVVFRIAIELVLGKFDIGTLVDGLIVIELERLELLVDWPLVEIEDLLDVLERLAVVI